MSPRRNHPKRKVKSKGDDREINSSNQVFEEQEDGLYVVRQLTGSSSTKAYRCPGCDQIIPMATPHIVAWRDAEEENRRHWHKACWNNRKNRKPKVERPRNAPKY